MTLNNDHLCVHGATNLTHKCICSRTYDHKYTELLNDVEQPALFDILE